MVPQTQKRKARNSTKVNLLFSLVFHGLIVVAVLYFAAREGLLGKQIKKIAVEMVKEKRAGETQGAGKAARKKPPKMEPPKIVASAEDRRAQGSGASPPPSVAAAPPVAAPRRRWMCPRLCSRAARRWRPLPTRCKFTRAWSSTRCDPAGTARRTWTTTPLWRKWRSAVDSTGRIGDPVWKKGSGNKHWDDSVRQALAIPPRAWIVRRRPISRPESWFVSMSSTCRAFAPNKP